jgi:hypothetical protein
MMTKDEWLSWAREEAEDLRHLVVQYHPSAREAREEDLTLKLRRWKKGEEMPPLDEAFSSREPPLPITARSAESACEAVRSDIVREQRGLGSIGSRFITALATGDVRQVSSLLSAAWFGVPESTNCWRIRGFNTAVDLLEDPPEDDLDD